MDDLWIWLVVKFTPLKNMTSSVGMIPNIWKNEKVPNHQPDMEKCGSTCGSKWTNMDMYGYMWMNMDKYDFDHATMIEERKLSP